LAGGLLLRGPVPQLRKQAGRKGATQAAEGDRYPARRLLRVRAHRRRDDGGAHTEGEGELAARMGNRLFEALGAAEVHLEVASRSRADEPFDRFQQPVDADTRLLCLVHPLAWAKGAGDFANGALHDEAGRDPERVEIRVE